MKQIGHATLTIELPDGQKETYLITLPRLRIDGIWYGSPYIELSESSYIQSSSGWLSTVSGFIGFSNYIAKVNRSNIKERATFRGRHIHLRH